MLLLQNQNWHNLSNHLISAVILLAMLLVFSSLHGPNEQGKHMLASHLTSSHLLLVPQNNLLTIIMLHFSYHLTLILRILLQKLQH
jgi:hypothetical protein